ncbi:hypothetical protein X943_002155 [Babesia divergens]|uniref:Uncharacterized protein n=1 Tax=Babesia divergens TaxID=32595 RepID=A0AAD9LEA4_BABDI|nr:hypothetical protein X943_002155 [Babesia divergens]
MFLQRNWKRHRNGSIRNLNGEVARLRDELDQVTSKEDGRVQMKVDLINERDYINKSIEELKINNRDRKAMYTNQIRDQIEAHKLRLKLLKSDDSSDLVEIIDEETKNSNILLNAALESLEVANAGDKSKVEAKYNAMMLEETEKFEAIRKVNASEILRLRELVKNRRSRVKDAATAPETMVAKLPEEATMVTQPNDVNVHFKTPTTSNSTPSNSHDRVVSPQSTVKKEVRRKCIRRSSIKAEGTKGNGEDELDLFC